MVVQTSNELRMMEQYAAPLLAVAKADDANAKLQGKPTRCAVICCCRRFALFDSMFLYFLSAELSKWLEPLEKLRFDISSIPTLISYIKQVKHFSPVQTG